MAGVLNFQDVDYISFDHDLGDEKHGNTGYATALLIELWAHDKKITQLDISRNHSVSQREWV